MHFYPFLCVFYPLSMQSLDTISLKHMQFFRGNWKRSERERKKT
jgi:hypothetical protein